MKQILRSTPGLAATTGKQWRSDSLSKERTKTKGDQKQGARTEEPNLAYTLPRCTLLKRGALLEMSFTCTRYPRKLTKSDSYSMAWLAWTVKYFTYSSIRNSRFGQLVRDHCSHIFFHLSSQFLQYKRSRKTDQSWALLGAIQWNGRGTSPQ